MNDPDLHDQIRAALLDLVLLRRPFEEAAEAVVPYLLRDYQGPPLVAVDRAAMRGAISACRSGALTARELQHWALLTHLVLTGPLGHPGRDPFLGWEPRARMLLRHNMDRLLDADEGGVTSELLQQIEDDLECTADWDWIARKPIVARACEVVAIAAWIFVAAPALAAHLPAVFNSMWVGAVGGFAISIAVVRLLRGADAAIERFQQYAPFALLGVAALGAAHAMGGTG